MGSTIYNYRYLLNIAYIGTPFRGAQRQVRRTMPPIDDPLTVQGRLEMALKVFKTENDPNVRMSSRTDAGVHAINSTCHVDLVRPNGRAYDPTIVTKCLNHNLKKTGLPLHVLKTSIVPNNFHCMANAVSRTYLYRILVAKRLYPGRMVPNIPFMPIEEFERCFFLCIEDSFDIEQMKEAATLFEGYHDFRTFMKKSPHDLEKDTKKTIYYIKIVHTTGESGYSSYSWPSFLPENVEYANIDIYMKSNGFLYNQVRRTVASLIAVAQGKITLRDIKFMLEIPSCRSWCPQVATSPAHGLYLCEVEYSERDLETFRTTADV